MAGGSETVVAGAQAPGTTISRFDRREAWRATLEEAATVDDLETLRPWNLADAINDLPEDARELYAIYAATVEEALQVLEVPLGGAGGRATFLGLRILPTPALYSGEYAVLPVAVDCELRTPVHVPDYDRG